MPTCGSVCSGAGGFDLGFRNAGYDTRWLCEVDPWRRKLLARNFAGVPCHPDLASLDPVELERVDVLIGGTPCQDLSNAGQREGLDGDRSVLFYDYIRIRHALNIEWCVWENVEGALSSNAGLDFASILGAFVGATVDVPGGGWPSAGVATGPYGGVVWRLLDAQYFGVPQRRRRVFVVGHLGGPCPPEVLFEPASGKGDLAAGGEAGPRVASPLTRGSSRSGVSQPGRRQEDDFNIVAATLKASGVSGGRRTDVEATYVVGALDTQRGGPDDNSAQTLRSGGFDASEDGTGRGTPLVVRGESASRTTGERHRRESEQRRRQAGARIPSDSGRINGAASDADRVRAPDGLAGCLDGPVASGFDNYNMRLTGELSGTVAVVGAGNRMPHVMGNGAEAGVSAFDAAPDGRRYAACGDGVVAPVAEWIGRRLALAIEAA